MSPETKAVHSRCVWVDVVKGLTISLVVFHHVVSGLRTRYDLSPSFELAYAMLTPVRMPLFFMAAGLFAARALDLPRMTFFDRKILHFAYLFVLWSTISIVLRSQFGSGTDGADVELTDIGGIFWDPPPTLWFLYALAVVFILARAMHGLPVAVQIGIAFAMNAVALALPGDGAMQMPKNVGLLFVFFLIGLHFSVIIRREVDGERPVWPALLLLAIVVGCAVAVGGVTFPPIYCAIALLSAFVLMRGCRVIAPTTAGQALRFVGERSLPIYLLHFLPAAGARVVMNKLGFTQPYLIMVVGLPLSLIFCVVAYEILRRTPLNVLFVRPRALTIGERREGTKPA